MRITLMSIGGIADAAFPRGPCHGIMTASTLHALLSWFPRRYPTAVFLFVSGRLPVNVSKINTPCWTHVKKVIMYGCYGRRGRADREPRRRQRSQFTGRMQGWHAVCLYRSGTHKDRVIHLPYLTPLLAQRPPPARRSLLFCLPLKNRNFHPE